MIENILWIALLFLLIFVVLKESERKRTIGSIGWILFSLYWLTTVEHFLEIVDYFNVVLVCLMSGFCILVAYFIKTYKGEKYETLSLVTKVTALTCIIYFPFANIGVLNSGIITVTTIISNSLLNLMGVSSELNPPYILTGALKIEIILACTAIESIALFTGVILGVKAPKDRKLKGFMVSVPVIYLLNLFRNAIVIYFTKNETFAWFVNRFGQTHFYWAHHVFAKIGSFIALIAIAYAVFTILPEVLDMIEDLYNLFTGNKNKGDKNAN